ncbi:MAG TPA: hypothetical protein VKU19_06215 [Bryobacteraceae bacterium]|nr:hypothetical protein [Bryobacteraceae bacterium]
MTKTGTACLYSASDVVGQIEQLRPLKTAGIWLVALGAAFGLGCDARTQAPDDIAIEESFRPFYGVRPEAAATSDLDIYVDGSMSMRGYVLAQNSNYSQMIREVLQSATAAQFNLNIYKFTSTVTPVTRLPLGQLQTPGFYDGRDTPLATLLSQLANETSHTAIIISDLVQSDGGVDSLGLVKSLSQLAGRGLQMRLLGYRSSFDGDYYPESRAGGLGQRTFRLTMSQSLPGTGRPFYLFVVAPNAESMKRVDNYVLNRFPAVQTFNPTAPPVSVDNVELQTQGIKATRWSLYSRLARRETATARRLDSAFVLTTSTPGIAVTLPLTFQVQFNLPLRQPGRLSFEAVRATWSRKSGLKKPAPIEIPVTGEFDKGGQRILLRLTVSKPEPQGWDVYYLKMRAGEANLSVPAWVIDWNTDNDSVVTNGNRTFLLTLLVQAMANGITERVVFCEYMLKVGKGD